MRNTQKKSIDIFLIILLSVALFIRLINPAFGSPVLYVNPDEVPNYLAALNMLSKKTLTTNSQYPPLGSYIMLPFLGFTYLLMHIIKLFPDFISFKFYLVSHEGFLIFVPRIIYSVLGFLNLVVIYKICRRLFPLSRLTAVFAITSLVFSVTHLQISHTAKPWTGALLFYLLSINEIISFYKSRRIKEFLKANIYAAIGIGFHFSAIFVLGIIWIFSYKYIFSLRSWPNKLRFYIIGLLPLVAFFLFKKSIPYSYESELGSYLQYNLKGGVADNVLFYFQELLLTEFGLVIVFLLSLLLFKRWTEQLKLIFIFCFLYFIFICIFWCSSIRFLLPIIVLLPLLASPVFNFISSKLSQMKIQLIFVTWVVILIIPGFYWLIIFLRTPTFIEAMYWTNQELSPRISIASNSVRFSSFVPDKNAITVMQKTQSQVYQQLYELLPNSEYADNVRNIIYLEKTVDVNNFEQINEFLLTNQVLYVFQYYWFPQQRWVNQYPNIFTLVKRFSPGFNDNIAIANLLHVTGNYRKLFNIYRFGPYIDVLRINPIIKGSN